MITKELIDRYLRNECNEDERRLVMEYLAAHPEEMEQHLPEEEFTAQQHQDQLWEKERSEQALQSIKDKLFKRPAVIHRLRAGLAAASVILVIGMVWFFSRGKEARPGYNNPVTAPLADVMERRTNMTAATITVALMDGSTVDLAPNSEIEYKKAFTGGSKRMVKLQGEALFSVAKDKTRSFVVMSEDLTTTVLGTSFSVKAYAAEPTIKVRLFTGKVAVNTKTRTDSTIGLAPGDELIYDRQAMTAKVTSFREKKDLAVSTSRKAGKTRQPDWYMFGGQPLPQVFDQLSEYYGVEINFYPSDVSNRYFTGKFSKTDSIETILKDISLLHDLTLKKTDGVYIFRKKKH
jgi:ferric-dicitrate binding protein FerR (iron transport regulator)